MRVPFLLVMFCVLCLGGFGYAEEEPTVPYDGPVYEGPKEDLHLYLLIGQSNMAGRANFPEGDDGAIPRCYLLNADGVFEPAAGPLNRYSTVRKALKKQKMNPGNTFSQEMLKQDESISIGLVVNAKGGSKIKEWKKGTQFYEEAVKRALLAKEFGTFKGILWHQGEGNAGRPKSYAQKLGELITNLRQDLDEPNLPVVAGQVFYHPERKPRTNEVNAEIAKFPEVVPFAGYVSSEGLTTFDDTHFDTEGMKLLGQRYAEEMLKIQLEQKGQ